MTTARTVEHTMPIASGKMPSLFDVSLAAVPLRSAVADQRADDIEQLCGREMAGAERITVASTSFDVRDTTRDTAEV